MDTVSAGSGRPIMAAWIRLAICGTALIAAVVLSGLIGYHNGYGQVLNLDGLQYGMGAAVADGVRLIWASPSRMFEAGLIDTAAWGVLVGTLLVGAGFFTLAQFGPPVDSQAEVRRNVLIETACALGAAVSLLASAFQFGLLISRDHTFVTHSPTWGADSLGSWLEQSRMAAGLDVIALISATIWLLYALRLRLPNWLRLLTVSLSVITLGVVFVGWCVSNGNALHLTKDRPVIAPTTGALSSSGLLMLGHTTMHLVAVSPAGQLEYIDPLDDYVVLRRATVVDFVALSGVVDEGRGDEGAAVEDEGDVRSGEDQ